MKRFNTLTDALIAKFDFDKQQIVGYKSGQQLTWKVLKTSISGWQASLKKISSRYIFIQLADTDDFIACLLACWMNGKVPVISSVPLNSIDSLSFNNKNSLVQTRDSFVAGVDPQAEVTDRIVEYPAPACLMFTSGSSGKPIPVVKHFFQFDAELKNLELLWGDIPQDSVFVKTVSHHHMFGLPFGILWPLLRGSPIYLNQVEYPESISSLTLDHNLTLISSPVFLDNLHDRLDWTKLNSRINMVYSAGSALSQETARLLSEKLTQPVTEIYGSTETGAIAWKNFPENENWQCLPDIKVSNIPGQQQLRVMSPSISEDNDSYLELSDTGTVYPDNSFTLLGRTDSIVKVGGKRISLTAIDNKLNCHPWVHNVRTLQLEERNNRIGAVIELTPSGKKRLIDSGKASICSDLKASLKADIDSIALPRYWRFTSKMPLNREGKTTVEVLHNLFRDNTEYKFPNVLSVDKEVDNQCTLRLIIPENLYYFNGHFPGRPVLPGVVQVTWAVHYARQYFQALDVFEHLEVIKFQHVILPGYGVNLNLKWLPDTGKLHFKFSSDTHPFSSGRIVFTPNESI